MNDTLYLFCVPNEQKNELLVAKKEYGKETNDFDDTAKGKGSKKENSFSKYLSHKASHHFSLPLEQPAIELLQSVAFIKSSFIANPDIPPERSYA